MVSAERAEATLLDADVGEVDVTVNNVSYEVTYGATAHLIGNHYRGVKL